MLSALLEGDPGAGDEISTPLSNRRATPCWPPYDSLASIRWTLGDFRESRVLIERAVAVAEQLGNDRL